MYALPVRASTSIHERSVPRRASPRCSSADSTSWPSLPPWIFITVPAGVPLRGVGAEPSWVDARSAISGSESTNLRNGLTAR